METLEVEIGVISLFNVYNIRGYFCNMKAFDFLSVYKHVSTARSKAGTFAAVTSTRCSCVALVLYYYLVLRSTFGC